MVEDAFYRFYPEDHYWIYFNQRNGTFVRAEEDGFPEPEHNSIGPELLDISITDRCYKECGFCYKNSTPNGLEMSFEDYEGIISQSSKLGVLQVALGGGNPNEHSRFVDILKITREKYNIVPNYSTNGHGLSKDVIQASKDYCGGVALSFYEPLSEFTVNLDLLTTNDIKTNIHFLIKENSIETAIHWLKNPPSFLDSINGLIFLNHKSVGRSSDALSLSVDDIQRFLNAVKSTASNIKIGFDSCCVAGVCSGLDVNKFFYDGCEGGRFSAYIREDVKMLPCSFIEDDKFSVDLKKTTLAQAWAEIQKSFLPTLKDLKTSCSDCRHLEICRGGCPVFPDINYCF